MATQGVEIDTKVSSSGTLCDELQQKIDHNHSYTQKNLHAIYEKPSSLDSITF